MIEVAYNGQFGNQLHQFCIGKILAERTGQGFAPRAWLNKAGEPLKWNMRPFLLPTPTVATDKQPPVGTRTLNCDHWIDLNDAQPGWSIRASGFFQRYAILKPYKEKIRREWLPLQTLPVKTDNDAVYIHVRRTDYLGDHLSPERNCQATTIEEYAACLKRFPDVKRIVMVTDDYSDAFLHQLKSMADVFFGLHATMLPATWDQDFLTLASCRNLIMSQSTFSWWAAFLGFAEKIVCPVFPNTFWGKGVGLYGPPKGRDFPNLFVDDEPGRWEWVTQ